MQTFVLKCLFFLCLLCPFPSLLKSQVHVAPTVEFVGSYENGGFAGFGVGIRIGKIELLPSFLLGEGKGAKLEFRWYQKFESRQVLRPFFSVQQVVFRSINTCVNNSCPFVFYQFLPGVGTALKVWKRAQVFGSVNCGIKKREQRQVRADFNVGIGVRYEF